MKGENGPSPKGTQPDVGPAVVTKGRTLIHVLERAFSMHHFTFLDVPMYHSDDSGTYIHSIHKQDTLSEQLAWPSSTYCCFVLGKAMSHRLWQPVTWSPHFHFTMLSSVQMGFWITQFSCSEVIISSKHIWFLLSSVTAIMALPLQDLSVMSGSVFLKCLTECVLIPTSVGELPYTSFKYLSNRCTKFSQ